MKKLIKLYYKINNTLFKRKQILKVIDILIDSRRHYFFECIKAYANNEIESYEYYKEKWEHYRLLIEEKRNSIF